MNVFADARQNMVDNQLRPNKVTDPQILAAMADLPRERFVPKVKQGIAYIDEDIEVAPDRYLMEPVVLARLLQALELTSETTVLNIGCATGYDAALLGRLVGSVVAIESDPALVALASEAINELAIDNVAVIEAPLEQGYAAQAPYDAIFISGAVDEVPPALADKLTPDGRLAVVVGGQEHGILGRAHLYVRSGDTFSSRPLFDAGTHMLPGFIREQNFVFLPD
ncbi:MAG: protein-L-isoaspartate O-methyltransferase [Alphaproteobacteria bacterium]|nr:protein-L-isoaspartate O-methyltransferase [Alphaproteobacteria bacterium]